VTALYMALTLSPSSLTSTWAIMPSVRLDAAALRRRLGWCHRAGDHDRERRSPLLSVAAWCGRSCGLGAGDDDVAEIGDGPGHARHEPGHLAGVSGPPATVPMIARQRARPSSARNPRGVIISNGPVAVSSPVSPAAE
jgi:hypothetical protein